MRIRSFSLPALPNSLWWGCLLFGVVLRIGYAYLLGDQWLLGDGGEYYQDALRWGRGEFPSPFWPPGLSLYLAGWFQLVGRGIASATAGMLLWHLALGISWHLAARKHLSPQIAIWGQWLLAIYPTLVHHAVVPLSQLPVAVALFVSWWAYLEIKAQAKHPLGWLILMGVCLLLAVMFRPASLAIVPIFGWLVYRVLVPAKRRWLLLPGLILLLGIGSWQGLLWQQTGRWIWFNEGNSMNVWIGNNPWTPNYRTWWLGSHDEGNNPIYQGFYEQRAAIRSLPPKQQSAAYLQAATRHIRQHPGQFIWRTINRIRTFLVIDTYAAGNWRNSHPWLGRGCFALDALIWFLLVGGILLYGDVSQPIFQLLWALCLLYALPYFLTFSHPTYRLAVFPYLLWLWGQGMDSPRFASPNWLSRGVLAAIFLLFQLEWVGRLGFLET